MNCQDLLKHIQDSYKTNTPIAIDSRFSSKHDVGSREERDRNVMDALFEFKLFGTSCSATDASERALLITIVEQLGINPWMEIWIPELSEDPRLEGNITIGELAKIIANKWLNKCVSLDLGMTNITATGIKVLCDSIALVGLPEGTRINLYDNPIWDDWIICIADMIKKTWLKRWVVFLLGDCWITAKWMKYFCNVIEWIWFEEDIELDFSWNSIGQDWIAAFMQLVKNKGLREWMTLRMRRITTDPKIPREVEFLSLLEQVKLPKKFSFKSGYWESDDVIAHRFLFFLQNTTLTDDHHLEVYSSVRISRELGSQISAVVRQKNLQPIKLLGYERRS